MKPQTPKQWVIAAGVILVVILGVKALGGGGKSSPARSTDAATTDARPAADARTLAAIRSDFRLNFGGGGNAAYRTTWYTPASNLTLSGGTLEAHTGWYYDDEGKDIGAELCRALAGNYGRQYNLDGVFVYSANDLVLAHTSVWSGECKRG